MKLSNFRLDRVEGDWIVNRKYFASVDVETGWLFWKKVERKNICRPFGGFYFFVDSGEFAPVLEVEKLARSWSAKTGQEC